MTHSGKETKKQDARPSQSDVALPRHFLNKERRFPFFLHSILCSPSHLLHQSGHIPNAQGPRPLPGTSGQATEKRFLDPGDPDDALARVCTVVQELRSRLPGGRVQAAREYVWEIVWEIALCVGGILPEWSISLLTLIGLSLTQHR